MCPPRGLCASPGPPVTLEVHQSRDPDGCEFFLTPTDSGVQVLPELSLGMVWGHSPHVYQASKLTVAAGVEKPLGGPSSLPRRVWSGESLKTKPESNHLGK